MERMRKKLGARSDLRTRGSADYSASLTVHGLSITPRHQNVPTFLLSFVNILRCPEGEERWYGLYDPPQYLKLTLIHGENQEGSTAPAFAMPCLLLLFL